jgi:hypothetical protein
MYTVEHIEKLIQFAKDHDLSFPEGFEEYSIDWLCAQYNGIGAEWMPLFVRKFLTKYFSPLEPASFLHDIEFLSDDKSFWKFTVANFRLLINGIKSGQVKSSILCAFACQLFGWSAWKNGKELNDWLNYLEENGNE